MRRRQSAFFKEEHRNIRIDPAFLRLLSEQTLVPPQDPWTLKMRQRHTLSNLARFHWITTDWFSSCSIVAGGSVLICFVLCAHVTHVLCLNFHLWLSAELEWCIDSFYIIPVIWAFRSNSSYWLPLTHDQLCGLLTWITDFKSMQLTHNHYFRRVNHHQGWHLVHLPACVAVVPFVGVVNGQHTVMMFSGPCGPVYYYNGCFSPVLQPAFCLLCVAVCFCFFLPRSGCCCWNSGRYVKFGRRAWEDVCAVSAHARTFVCMLWLHYFVLSQILWIARLIFPFIPYSAFTNRPCHILFICSRPFIYSTCPPFLLSQSLRFSDSSWTSWPICTHSILLKKYFQYFCLPCFPLWPHLLHVLYKWFIFHINTFILHLLNVSKSTEITGRGNICRSEMHDNTHRVVTM